MSIFIFALTIFSILYKPFNLKIWIYSVIGAVLSLSFGFVDSSNLIVIFELVWESSLTLIGLIIFSFSLEKLGFFDFVVYKILYSLSTAKSELRLRIHTLKLFIFTLLFCAIFSVIFGNDGAILIVTPIILKICFSLYKVNKKISLVFLLSTGFICDSASNALIISNLTNIIGASFFDISFVEFFKEMFLANIVSIVSSILISTFIFYKIFPKFLDFKLESKHTESKNITFCFVIILLFLASFLLNIHIAIVVCTFGLISLLKVLFTNKNNALDILKTAPYDILLFSFGLFVVVFGVYNEVKNEFNEFILEIIKLDLSVVIFGLISAIGASFLNNLPMVLFGVLGLDSSEAKNLVYSLLLACNIGAKLTPIGSLATILWLSILSKNGVKISLKDYLIFSLKITPFVLLFSLLALNL